jgi:hypothetical protein
VIELPSFNDNGEVDEFTVIPEYTILIGHVFVLLDENASKLSNTPDALAKEEVYGKLLIIPLFLRIIQSLLKIPYE